MKKRALTQHLERHDCRLLRQGRNHEWWENSGSRKRSAVPRHTEIPDVLANKICKDLGIPVLDGV